MCTYYTLLTLRDSSEKDWAPQSTFQASIATTSFAAWIMWSSAFLWCFAASFSNHFQCSTSHCDLATTSTSVSSSRFLWLYWEDSLWDLSTGSLYGQCTYPSYSCPSLAGHESFWWDNPGSSSPVWWVCDQPSHKQLVSTSHLLCLSFHALTHWHKSITEFHVLMQISSTFLLTSAIVLSESHNFIHPGQQSIQDFFVVQSCC